MDIHSSNGTSSSCSSSPIPTSRPDPNSPHPTTFITADASSFKQVVQMLTGSPTSTKNDTVSPPPTKSTFVIPPIKTVTGKKHQSGFKLYERRNSLKHRLLMISPQNASFKKPQEILSPSVLDFPSLTLSPVTPLYADQFDKSSQSSAEEERAIAEKGFYFHPSPLSTPRDGQLQLLPLFPVTSPRVSDPCDLISN